MMYRDFTDLTGKVVLNAGGYGGLGAEATRAYVECGATVVIAGHNEEKAKRLEQEILAAGGKAEAFCCDCTNEADVIRLVEHVDRTYGRLDIMVNFLGGNIPRKAEEFDLDAWERILRNNLTSCMLLCRESGKIMIRQNYGKIVLIGSVRSELGLPREYVGYCAAKGGIKLYGKCLAAEWAQFNICVNVVAPTMVETDQVAYILEDPARRKSFFDRIPLGRFGTPQDVAAACLFFSVPATDFITGQCLLVDGGVTSRQ